MKRQVTAMLTALALGGAVSLLATPSAMATPVTKCKAASAQMVTKHTLNPIRVNYYASSRLITNLGQGYKVRLTQQCVNSYGNLWYFTDSPYSHGWIYSGDLSVG
ncbi:hypothetical protein OIB37_06325 [Streptomyces sp. NBC_00820]|uniref:hypothetical protein n=1 Tax=Streptomyces sp. NBC_00820 TaxID=2975842 RepID=UPI002ED4E859|nr:hypothetical protein OIB37_06325 [Streptomyces sp. NBC_00820]